MTVNIVIEKKVAADNDDNSNEEFQRLMTELGKGSEDAAWKIAEIYTPHILKVVRATLPAVIRPKLDSQDFVQVVWASLLFKRSYLARVNSPQQLITILSSTARHKVIDVYRHYTRTEAHNVRVEQRISADANHPQVFDRDPTPSETIKLRDKWEHLLAHSSARDRKILAMRIKGLSYDAIGQKLDLHGGTVRRLLKNLLDELRR